MLGEPRLDQFVVRVNRKYLITLPKEVRRRLNVSTGDKVPFHFRDDGTIEMRRVAVTLESIIGSLDELPKAPIDLDREIEEGIEEALAQRRD